MAKYKKKKEKIIYYDDGSTVADMSNLSPKKPKVAEGDLPRNSLKSKLKTFFGAMRLMVIPMLAVICMLGLMYGIIYLLFTLVK